MNLSDGFRIGDWDVLPREGRMVRARPDDAPPDLEEPDAARRVRRKAMDVLCVLAASAGQVVERDALLTAVWGRTAVTDEPLTSTIGELRRLLGDRQGAASRYIETIPKRGYRLLADVEPLRRPAAPFVAESAPRADQPAAQSTADAGPPAYQRATAQSAGVPADRPRREPATRIDLRAFVVMVGIAAFVAFAFQYAGQRAPATEDTTVAPVRSIAVLPFDDMSPDGTQRYFADGLAEELISLLTRRSALFVAARNSAFSFRDQGMSTADIAARLKVAHVLTGSVRHDAGRVRVTAQLIDVRAGYQLWSNSYDRELGDIFAIQVDIATEVAQQLSEQLLGVARAVRETDSRAYTLYLQARHVGRQHTQDGLTQAVDLYRQALAIDDQYLPAWNELAGVYVNMAGFALLPPEEAYQLAREAAYRALAIDPDYAPALDRLGWMALHEGNNLPVAAEHYRRALQLEPGNESIRANAAVLAVGLGRLGEAVALLELSAARDPVSPISHANLANAYLLARRYPEAERSIRNALTLSPQYAGAHYRLGRVLLAQNDVDGARAAFEAEPVEVARLLGQALVCNAERRYEDSDTLLAQVRADWADRAAGNYAQVYAHRGDIDAAFGWLDIALKNNGTGAFMEYRLDPLFDALLEDPRWPALLERFGFGPDQLARVSFPPIDELPTGPATPKS
jgi:TolB-like protein/DNA-binding winged helix-turn-helix (wHTH) protein/predicted Zn-dependent protease